MRFLFAFLFIAAAPSFAEGPLSYVKTPTGYLMVLRQGENVLRKLEEFAAKENPPSASFTGMGFVSVKFGFYNFKNKKFEPREFKAVELASLNGSVAWQDGKPSIHAHGVVAGKDFKAYGGHILDMEVGTGSAEITILVHDKKLERKIDETIGANVLQLGK